MGRRAAGGGRDALGPSRLHDPRTDVLVRPPRANRPGAEASGGNPRTDALDPPAELRNPGGLDPESRLSVLPHPSDGGRDLLSAVRLADQLDGTRVAPAEGEIDAHRAGRSLRDGWVHADWHGGRASLLDERPRADRRPDPGDPDREREVVMDVLLLSEPEVRELIGPAEALPAVRDAFARLARGEASLPGVVHLDVPNSGAEVHVKGAHLQGSRFFTIKVASGSYANPERGLPVGSGIVLVFDSTTGFPKAVLFDNGYLTAVGADGPDKQELDVEVLKNADKVVADRLDQCIRFGEIHHAIEAGVLRPGDVYAELGEIAAGLKRGRTSDQEITVADLTGVGVQDAAVAELVVGAALRRGTGKRLDL